MGVVRSAVHNSILASLFQMSDTQDRFKLQSLSAIGPRSLVSNWNHSAVNSVINFSDRRKQ